jgi:hypothetical protein
MVVALIALFVAMGGTSYAAVTLGKNSVGSKQLKKNAVTTAKIKNHAVTGKKIKLSTLGTVPTAANVTGLLRWRKTVATPGSSITSPNTVVLTTDGPFTILGGCYLSSGDTEAQTFIETSGTNDYAEGYYENGTNWHYWPLTPDTLEPISPIYAESTSSSSPSFEGPDDGTWAAETGNGSLALNGLGNQGTYMDGASGPACSFSGFAVTE